jgi:hypothetical protein
VRAAGAKVRIIADSNVMLLSVRARSLEMTVVVVPLMFAIFIMPAPVSDICSCIVTSA